MTPEIKIALELHKKWLSGNSDGIRLRKPAADFTGTDFTGYSLAHADLRHSNLTGCIMPPDCSGGIFSTTRGTNVDWSNSDITDTNFETADISGFNFIGATWDGFIINAKPEQLDGEYWNMLTNAFMQIGCEQKTFKQWEAMTDDARRELVPDNPESAVDWWRDNYAFLKLFAGTSM